jgi:hypothetical protein
MTNVNLRALVLAALLSATALAQGGAEQAGLLEEARRTVMIPHSKGASTADLKLSADATRLVDAYLDYCRNRWQRRSQASPRFRGTPHSVWGRDGDRVTYSVRFTNLHIVDASVPVAEAAGVLRALRAPGYRNAVRVEGDEDELLDLWAVALSGRFAEQVEGAVRAGARGLDRALWKQACEAAATPLVEGWAETPPMKEVYPRGIHPSGRRKVYLDAIRVLAQERSGAILKQIHEELAKGDNPVDTKIAALALAAAQGEAANAFVLAELASGDPGRQRVVLRSIGPHAGPEVLAATNDLLAKSGKDAALTMIALGALRRTAEPGSPQAATARGLLLAYARGLPERSVHRPGVVLALAATAAGDEQVLAFLREELKSARERLAKAPESRKRRYESYVRRLEEALPD